jgi:hypothetical protein
MTSNKKVRQFLGQVSRKDFGKSYDRLSDKEADKVRKHAYKLIK